MAHFDTGASVTSIDLSLAAFLELRPIGKTQQYTANGASETPTFVADILFQNSKLAPFVNLQIGSCQLPFNMERYKKDPFDIQNFGLLIGRDIMSRWNIVWNGPTSSVFIAD